MTFSSAPGAASRPSAWCTILAAGLLAGALDIGYVFAVFRTADPIRILQSIAAGAVGRSAYDGGWPLAALGLAFHFTIALAAAAVFYGVSRWRPRLVRQAVVAGLAYGVVVWLVMNLVVLPLSATPPKTFPPPGWRLILLAHLFCVGLPISLVVRRANR